MSKKRVPGAARTAAYPFSLLPQDPLTHASGNILPERGSQHQKYFRDMSFVDVEAEEEGGSSAQNEEPGSSSDADTSLSGFICEDDSVDSPSNQGKAPPPPPGSVKLQSNPLCARALKAKSKRIEVDTLFDPDESLASGDSIPSESSLRDQLDDECEAPRSFLGGGSTGFGLAMDKREVQFDDKTLEVPSFVNSVSVVLQDGICAEMEVEPFDVWRRSSARPLDHPCFSNDPTASPPADWFDELQFCKDRRGGYGVRSTRRVIAETAKIQFPCGRKIELPVKKIVVEHAFFPYDAATWEQPANFTVRQPQPIDSSDEDLVDPSEGVGEMMVTDQRQPELSSPDHQDCSHLSREPKKQSKKVRKQFRKESAATGVNADRAERIKKKSGGVKMSEDEEFGTAGYILSEDPSEGTAQEMAVPVRARMSTQKQFNINEVGSNRQDVLQRPVTRIKAHTATLQTTKQKLRRQRRLELMRLKRDLLEEDADLTRLWPLTERRTKRQVRNEQARKATTAQARAAARRAASNFLLPG